MLATATLPTTCDQAFNLSTLAFECTMQVTCCRCIPRT